ncbi:MAG TPA: AraC family transcriptional regulator [Pseudomonas xinjiangensis]|uniref:AraC family transcriptional regulator n=2 Tax=root TaxID=1 RepID=A0A7V1FRL8_9GAMM|nr:AraC family transcriptional regulator [Halopseudomonas xinjiangensis]HEC46402.1 AraC family transcriptional regulator [Halopseudomonas xinjiangensis]
MATPLRVTGAWIQLLTDWLDQEKLAAPELRNLLDSRRPADIVPMTIWCAMLERAARLRPEHPSPALAIGALVQPRHVGVLGYLILTCDTLGAAMQAYQRYERLFYGADVVSMQVSAEQVTVRWPGESSTGQLADTVAIAALLAFWRRLVEEEPVPTRVSFVFAAPEPLESREAYQRFFACPVSFGATDTAIQFPTAYLNKPLPRSEPTVRGLLDRQADALMLALPDSDSFDRALQQSMVRLLPEGRVSLPRVAADLHVSVRTLQRRLEDRQLTWRDLLDRTREQLAAQYLADASLTLGDIALLLGFSEQSAFTRAYRRWTAETPVQARRNILRFGRRARGRL